MRLELIFELSKYFVVSLVALGVDYAVLMTMSEYVYYLIATVAGFSVGSVVHYLMSISMVFRNRRMKHDRRMESSIYVAAGVAGLVVNVIVVAAGVEWLSMSLPFAKLAAAACAFLFGYVARKMLLF